jgi:hypothetical protein
MARYSKKELKEMQRRYKENKRNKAEAKFLRDNPDIAKEHYNAALINAQSGSITALLSDYRKLNQDYVAACQELGDVTRQRDALLQALVEKVNADEDTPLEETENERD